MLKTEDLKTAYLKAGDSKYAFYAGSPKSLNSKSIVIGIILSFSKYDKTCLPGLTQAITLNAAFCKTLIGFK